MITPEETLELFKSYVKHWSPRYAPRKWIIINGACCICTAVYFTLGWLPQDWVGYEVAKLTYIPFNFVLCIIWFIEVVFYMLFDEDPLRWLKLGELALATFFVGDAIIYLYDWIFVGEPLHRWEILVYTAIDFTVYLFYLILAIREEREATKRRIQARLKEQQLAPPSPKTPGWLVGNGTLETSGSQEADVAGPVATMPTPPASPPKGASYEDVECNNCPLFPMMFGEETETEFKLMTCT